MRTSPVVLLTGCLLFQGCAGLIIRDQDSTGVVVGKVAARVLAWVGTLTLSEVAIGTIKEREKLEASQQQAYQNRQNWLDGQVGQLTYSEALVKWGPPVQSQEHKGMIVAVWQSRRASPGYLLMPPIPGNPYSSSLAVALPESGSRLQLVFDRDTERLRSWSQDW